MEWLWALGWAGLLLVTAWRYRRQLCPWPGWQRWMLLLLALRLLAGVLQAAVWQQQWLTGGDSLMYYHSVQTWWQLLETDAETAWQVLTVPHGSAAHQQLYAVLKQQLPVLENHYALNLVRLLVPVYALAGGSYYALAVLCSALGFLGSWCIYRVLQHLAGPPNWPLLLSVVALPNTTFWQAGILKEPITLFALGGAAWLLHNAWTRGWRWRHLLMLPLIGIALFVKPYPLLACMAISLCVAGLYGVQHMLRQGRITWAWGTTAGGILLLVLVAYSVAPWLWAHLTGSYEFAITRGGGIRGSHFTTGWDTITWPSALWHSPQAAFAALYRPLLWEYPRWQGIVAGVDGALCLAATLVLAWRVRWRQAVQIGIANPWLVGLFVYALVYAAFLGLSVPYLGTLVRMRVYVLPIWLAAWVLLMQLSRAAVARPR